MGGSTVYARYVVLLLKGNQSAVTYKLFSLGLGNYASLKCIMSVSSLETLCLGSVNNHQVTATQPFE